MRVVEIGFALWSIAFVAHGQPAFAILVDEFDQLDPNHWEAIGGTWTADG